jgi:hypothetical protein
MGSEIMSCRGGTPKKTRHIKTLPIITHKFFTLSIQNTSETKSGVSSCQLRGQAVQMPLSKEWNK